MKSRNLTFITFTWFVASLMYGQTKADSIAIVSADWKVYEAERGITHKRATFTNLYKGNQFINLVEISPKTKMHYGISASESMKQTSLIAQANQASAAINGSFYNTKKGNSVCYFRIGKEVIDTTLLREFQLRVTGAVHTHKRKIQIMPWSPDIENKYRQKRGILLASGPLLLDDGKLCSWESCDSNFIHTKHPRSAIFYTKDKRVVFITVDGRSPGNAVGVNIPELAHLISTLGGYDAINLDGGGSTTLWTKEQGVLNSPSDNRKFDHQGERKISNIIYATKRR